MICNHDFDYFREVIDYDCDYIAFSINVIDYDYEFVIVIVIVPTNAITDYDYPMPAGQCGLGPGLYFVSLWGCSTIPLGSVRPVYPSAWPERER